MPKFRSLGQSLHIDNFCKNDGGEGGPLLSLTQKKPALLKCHQGKKFLPKSMGWAGGGAGGGIKFLFAE